MSHRARRNSYHSQHACSNSAHKKYQQSVKAQVKWREHNRTCDCHGRSLECTGDCSQVKKRLGQRKTRNMCPNRRGRDCGYGCEKDIQDPCSDEDGDWRYREVSTAVSVMDKTIEQHLVLGENVAFDAPIVSRGWSNCIDWRPLANSSGSFRSLSALELRRWRHFGLDTSA